MESKPPQLKDGSEWIDHEDCLVGDEQGLKNLIDACNTALKEGQYYGSDLGDYVGFKKLESSWFEDPKDSKETRLANVALAAFLFLLVALLLIGVGTVISWFF